MDGKLTRFFGGMAGEKEAQPKGLNMFFTKRKHTITAENKKEYRKKSGTLTLVHNGKALRQFETEDVYRLYCTLKSLSKRKTGTYSKLPRGFDAEFVPHKIKR